MKARASVTVTSLLAVLLTVLITGAGNASAAGGPGGDAHCVLDISERDAAPSCYATFTQAQDVAQRQSTQVQTRSAAGSVVLAVLYNNSNWQTSGGTLTLTGSSGCGGGGYWTNNFAGGFNDWANSVQTYNGCGIVLWEHANLGGRNTGYLTSSADLGWANNITSSWQIW